jgi:hypothetical protein
MIIAAGMLGLGTIAACTKVFGAAATHMEALMFGLIPFLIGTVALGSVTIVLAIDERGRK